MMNTVVCHSPDKPGQAGPDRESRVSCFHRKLIHCSFLLSHGQCLDTRFHGYDIILQLENDKQVTAVLKRLVSYFLSLISRSVTLRSAAKLLLMDTSGFPRHPAGSYPPFYF